MEDSVKRALQKWPSVPAAYGWLKLDERGNWLVGNSRLTHQRSLAFLNRNYLSDVHGQWLFQNGPQSVYAELAYTPYVCRLENSSAGQRFFIQTGQPIQRPDTIWLDEDGSLLIESEWGISLCDDRALEVLLDQFRLKSDGEVDDLLLTKLFQDPQNTANKWLFICPPTHTLLPVKFIRRAEVPSQFKFIATPKSPKN